MNRSHDPLGPVASAYVGVIEQIVAAAGRTRRGPDGTLLAISGAPSASLNAIISPSPEPDPEVIASLAAAESPWEFPWSLQVRGVPSPPVAAVAAQYGLTRFGRQPLMVRRPEEGLPAKPAIDSLRIRSVSADELGLYARTAADGFEAPHEAFQVFGHPALAKVEGATFYLAELDGRPVGTGMTSVTGDLTGVFIVATLPLYRRRGYGMAITMELVRAGFAAGAPTVYLGASEMGAPVYQSAGFRTEEYLTVITAPE